MNERALADDSGRRDLPLTHEVTVLYVVTSLRRTGPTVQLYNLIRHLDRKSVIVHLVSLSPESNDSLWESFKTLKIRMQSMKLSRVASMFLGVQRLQKLVDDLQPNVIHSQGFRADKLNSQIKSPATRLCTVRNFPQVDYPATFGAGPGKLLYTLHKAAFRRLDLCVAVSQAVAANLRSELAVGNVSIVHNGVDAERFAPVDERQKAQLRTQLGIAGESVVWIVTGHLNANKNSLFIIESFKKFLQRPGNSAHVLVFAGAGPLFERCKEEAMGCVNLKLTGHVNDVAAYLKASDYFVSASKSEGLPNAVLEGMACGLPVVLSDIPPHREILEFDTRAGVLFKSGDCNDFLRGLDAMQESTRKTRSEASRRIAVEHLSAERMANDYQLLYETLAQGGNR